MLDFNADTRVYLPFILLVYDITYLSLHFMDFNAMDII